MKGYFVPIIGLVAALLIGFSMATCSDDYDENRMGFGIPLSGLTDRE